MGAPGGDKEPLVLAGSEVVLDGQPGSQAAEDGARS